MTPGQLIDLLEKAGMLKEESPGVLGWHPTMEKAERFAALVANRCAEIAHEAEPYHSADLIRKAFTSDTCPPCNGKCRQGRDCPERKA